MALLRLTLGHDETRLHQSAQPAEPTVCNAARKGTGPIVIMLHGFKYQPGRGRDCAQVGLFASDSPDGWPIQLGLQNNPNQLGIAVGWNARGRLVEAFANAGALGLALARVIDLLNHAAPARKINIIAHSLGAELALSTIKQASARSISRVVLLTGASMVRHAQDALNSPAGQHLELLNVISRENDLFDYGFEQIIRAGRSLGDGIDAPNALSVQLDCDRTLAVLAGMQLPIAPSKRRICHWSSYTRPGAMAFYQRFLCEPEALSLDGLRAALPTKNDPRWWRLSLGVPPTAFGIRLKPPKPGLGDPFAKTS